ncbi:MAG: FHA domain-containing protein, partial [Armatimonadetes bacterium]|nr:FHA domain-containing protein [Armatimonadota bacterium]
MCIRDRDVDAAPTTPPVKPGQPLTGPVAYTPGLEVPKAKKKPPVTEAVLSAAFNVLPLALAGGLGGFLAWGILEPFENDEAVRQHLGEVLRAMAAYGGVMGACIAAAIGSVEGITSADVRKALRGAGLGLLIGLLGGALGGIFGQLVYGTLGGGQDLPILLQIIVRSLGWGMVGAFVGVAPGVLARAKKKIYRGIAGGLIGGLIGGFLFDPFGFLFGGGEVSRLVAQTVLGAAAGAAIAVVEQIAKEAWLVITAGPLTGKQFILYNPVTTIGRAYTCDIALVKEAAASQEHCRIRREAAGFVLEDLCGATAVNGRPVSRHRLQSGDVIQIGSTALLFHERAASQRAVPAP